MRRCTEESESELKAASVITHAAPDLTPKGSEATLPG